MTQREALKNFTGYMKSHNIPYVKGEDDGCLQYTMQYRADNAPDGYVESCIWFYEKDNAEVRIYYNARFLSNGCKSYQSCGNHFQEVIDYYGHNSRKITCDIYIDDKACAPENVGVV